MMKQTKPTQSPTTRGEDRKTRTAQDAREKSEAWRRPPSEQRADRKP